MTYHKQKYRKKQTQYKEDSLRNLGKKITAIKKILRKNNFQKAY